MKTLLTTILVLLVAATAFAQLENSMGVFFSDTELIPATTNFDPTPSVPFSAWLALLNSTQATIGGYECTVTAVPDLTVLTVTGPNGWTNFGTFFNHLVGYGAPLPSADDVVLATFQLMYLVDTPSGIVLGPSDPSSVGGEGPAIWSDNPFILVTCNYTSGPNEGGLVATLHGDGIVFPDIVAAETQNWSGVRSLFE